MGYQKLQLGKGCKKTTKAAIRNRRFEKKAATRRERNAVKQYKELPKWEGYYD